eukprot:11185307-Lingulodinium_polyedra.AAC.1
MDAASLPLVSAALACQLAFSTKRPARRAPVKYSSNLRLGHVVRLGHARAPGKKKHGRARLWFGFLGRGH